MNPLESLPLTAPPRRPLAGRLVEVAGVLVVAVIPGALLVIAALVEPIGEESIGFLLALAFLPALALGVSLYRKGRRMRAPSAMEILRAGRARFVLFLRSFGDEQLLDPSPKLFQLTSSRYEESICDALRPAGQIIAVGRPGEGLPEMGAARLYVDDAHWKKVVEELMKAAVLVFFVVGRTEGIRWEIEAALRLVPRERLVLFFPYLRSETQAVNRRNILLDLLLVHSPVSFTKRQRHKMRALRESRYQGFRSRFAEAFDSTLPQSLGDRSLLVFSARGEPELVETVGRSWMYSLMQLRSGELDINFKRTLAPILSRLSQNS